MARTARDNKIDTRTARAKLKVRPEPYFRTISKGCALGYRRGSTGGTWIARYIDETNKKTIHAIGVADDHMDSDGGATCMTFAEAQREAAVWFKRAARGFEDAPQRGRYTVAAAVEDYLNDYVRRGGKAVDRTKGTIEAHILPALGDIDIEKLSRRKIETWHEAIAKAPPRVRTRKGEAQRYQETDDNEDAIRKRRNTANRILTILKALLNHAHSHRKVDSKEAWDTVKAFRNVNAARIRYLNDDEARRLVNACDPDFRALVQAALLTGARYGELARLVASDFNPDTETVHIRISKDGKPRHIFLGEEGVRMFASACAGKRPTDRIFTREDGSNWGKSHQHRRIKTACEIAGIEPMAFHELRHTYASRLVMKAVPLSVIAQQLGHSDTRMVEKHYGHMAASYVADTIRLASTSMGVFSEANVVRLARA